MLILDLREQTILADYFVIASAETVPHVRAIAEAVDEQLSAAGKVALRREGRQEARWILMDYGSVVVHVMDEDVRDYYDLEHFWRDAPRIELAEMAQLARASQ